MPRPIHYRSQSENPAERVYQTLVDREYLHARLEHIGGKDAALLDLDVEPDRARYTLRQGVDRRLLPAVVQRILPGDLIIERTEIWRREKPGRYEGTVSADVHGAPGSVRGELLLADLDSATGSELVLTASTRVDIPLVGGKIEAVIAEQVIRLVDSETQFTLAWLA